MGRGKVKLRKLTVTTDLDDPKIGEEEKVIAQKRRGRPQKQVTDELGGSDQGEMANPEEEIDSGNRITNQDDDSKEIDTAASAANEKKRKPDFRAKVKPNAVKEESRNDTRTSKGSIGIGFRHTGSRRKNKPRRAAEAGVDCWWNYSS